ncbi:MAG: ABC transporter permease [Alphaproteobacteria bacterium]|nr:ABC transporter permease [Alphaproteobacteria bacterium]
MNRIMLSARRIYALIYRYCTLLLHSIPRLVETLYWPIINTMLLGFMNYYLLKQRGLSEGSFHTILGATLLLEFFIRSQFSFMLVFMEELYSRNLGQLYTSPLRSWEQLAAYVITALLRTAAVIPAMLICNYLFDYNILSLHEWLLPFVLNMLLAGITCGVLIVCLLIRFGQSAEWFGWMFSWAFIPFMGVYYPISVLPEPLQIIGHALPISVIFENLRNFAVGGVVDSNAVIQSTFVNLAYLAGAIAVFFWTLKGARVRGNLLNLNE